MTFDLEAQLEISLAAYFANSNYYETKNTAAALTFATACQQLILLLPSHQRQAGRFEIDIDTKTLASQKDAAQLFAALNSGDVGVRGFDFTNFRDT